MKRIQESFDDWKEIDSYLDPDELKNIKKLSSQVGKELGWDIVAAASFCLDLLEDVNFHGVGADIAKTLLAKLKKDGIV